MKTIILKIDEDNDIYEMIVGNEVFSNVNQQVSQCKYDSLQIIYM